MESFMWEFPQKPKGNFPKGYEIKYIIFANFSLLSLQKSNSFA